MALAARVPLALAITARLASSRTSSVLSAQPAWQVGSRLRQVASSTQGELLASTVKALLADGTPTGVPVVATGWIRSARFQKAYSFMELNDGSTSRNLQIVWSSTEGALPDGDRARAGTGACVKVEGILVSSPKPGQPVEMQAKRITVVGASDGENFPLQKKAHSAEFLRDMVHLRSRTSATGAMLRIRDTLQHALHSVLREDGCVSVNTPILTSNDCEGAGELFSVLPAADLKAAVAAGPQPRSDGKTPNQASLQPADRFFGKPVYLTVSGQLHLEAFACALGRVYTFGPTFRAEDSNTTRHACEFWMLEPELAPGSMHDAMDLAERCVKGAMAAVLRERPDDVRFLAEKGGSEAGLADRLAATADTGTRFARMTYTEAVAALRGSGRAFTVPVSWGDGLASEHERFLAEEVVKGPLFVTDYPAAIKPFYMKASPPRDGEPGPTVQAFDLLMPGLGELVGGSAREDDHGVLAGRMAALELLSPARAAALAAPTAPGAAGAKYPPADCNGSHLDWYLDLRRFGSVPHAGFGLGFERLVMLATGIPNIRDVLPIPRVPDSCRM